MNWVGGLISNWFRPRQVGGVWFYPVNNDSWADIDLLNSFLEIPELNAVIDCDARAFSSGIIRLINSKGEKLPDDNVVKLLRNPNWFQAEKEFMRQTRMFRSIFGNEYIYGFFGVGLKPINTKALYTLPPNLVKCEYDQTARPFFMETELPDGVKYTYKDGKREQQLPTEQLIHLNDNRTNVTAANLKQFLTGESKLKALRPAINNLRMAYETRGVILKRRGALGILSNASSDVSGQIPMTKKERDNLQQQYRQYGGLESQDNLIISNANLKWQAMTVSPDKLGLFTETKEDFFKIADAYGTPMELFASSEGSTYENQKEARKGMYDNTTIPAANEWVGALNKFFYGVDSNVRLIMDYSHLSIFQQDLEKMATGVDAMISALSKAFTDKAITIEEYKSELNKIGIATGIDG